ncbi:MAG: inositol monophosphatase family protein [Burkholderia sp.]|nr:inositol monophosphatase family protein [Burkholderia sp.]
MYHPMIKTAVKAARRAGHIINRIPLNFDLIEIRKKYNDFIIKIDKSAEETITDILKTAYPNHKISSEKSYQLDRKSEFQWIVDPINGITNFIHGFPYYCVSIALVYKGIITQAVIYDPNKNDLFTATRGRGAYLNDRRIRVSQCSLLSGSVIGTCLPLLSKDNRDNYKAYTNLFIEIIQQTYTGLRCNGATALDLANVAAGRLDGFFKQQTNIRDISAGCLLITEAGGLTGNYTGEADLLDYHEIVAANPKIYAQIIRILNLYNKVKWSKNK